MAPKKFNRMDVKSIVPHFETFQIKVQRTKTSSEWVFASNGTIIAIMHGAEFMLVKKRTRTWAELID